MSFPDWYDDAACMGEEWLAFVSARDVAPALDVCRRCPVKATCLAYALDTFDATEDVGVWGGTTVEERKRMRGRLSSARCLTAVDQLV